MKSFQGVSMVDDTGLELQNSPVSAYQETPKRPIFKAFRVFRIPPLTKEKQLLQSP